MYIFSKQNKLPRFIFKKTQPLATIFLWLRVTSEIVANEGRSAELPSMEICISRLWENLFFRPQMDTFPFHSTLLNSTCYACFQRWTLLNREGELVWRTRSTLFNKVVLNLWVLTVTKMTFLFILPLLVQTSKWWEWRKWSARIRYLDILTNSRPERHASPHIGQERHASPHIRH